MSTSIKRFFKVKKTARYVGWQRKQEGTGRKSTWNLACKFVNKSINHSSIKKKGKKKIEKEHTPFDFTNPAQLLQKDLSPYHLFYFKSLFVSYLNGLSGFLEVTVAQVPIADTSPFPCSVPLLQGRAVPQLCILSCRKAKGGGSSQVSRPGEGGSPGSHHPSIQLRCVCFQVKTPH